MDALTRKTVLISVGVSAVIVGGSALGWYLSDDDDQSRGEVRGLTREAVDDLGQASYRDQSPNAARHELEVALDLAAGRHDTRTPKVATTDVATREETTGDGPRTLMTYYFTVTGKGGGNAVCLTFTESGAAAGQGVGLYDIAQSDGECRKEG
ncbi:hypothetical protein LO772_10200 [Yinghuangia sp. ASG 101]|uniref:hypothetical protein n=1 Tax=Yinghuangia sp. ASG 101 TaxID=2896848 RepID=UPI001E2ECC6B|nr:hypothetical protein [Yinghuangia sp. ASG 101]UGQ13928.1 hypothetical protein LO772_10200 [Yinghuangia sp. ASG 101]